MPGTLEKCGAPLEFRGLLFLVGRSASEWTKDVTGEMGVFRSFVQRVALNSSFSEWVRASASLRGEMGTRVAISSVWRRVVVSQASRFSLSFEWRLIPLPSASGYSACRMVFGYNPADLFRRGGDDEDLLFAQDTSLSGQSAQQWKLRIMVQEAASRAVGNSELCRLLARNKSFNCTDVHSGDTNRNGAPRC